MNVPKQSFLQIMNGGQKKMDKTYTVAYDGMDGPQIQRFTPDDVESIEFETNYINIKFTNGKRQMWPWQSIIFVEEE